MNTPDLKMLIDQQKLLVAGQQKALMCGRLDAASSPDMTRALANSVDKLATLMRLEAGHVE